MWRNFYPAWFQIYLIIIVKSRHNLFQREWLLAKTHTFLMLLSALCHWSIMQSYHWGKQHCQTLDIRSKAAKIDSVAPFLLYFLVLQYFFFPSHIINYNTNIWQKAQNKEIKMDPHNKLRWPAVSQYRTWVIVAFSSEQERVTLLDANPADTPVLSDVELMFTCCIPTQRCCDVVILCSI